MTSPNEQLSAQKNAIVTQWSKELVGEIKTEIGRLKLTDKGNLKNSIRRRVKREFGDPSAVTIYYRYYGMFMIPGVGKGWPLKKVKGMNARLNPRKPRDWYNTVTENRTAALADQLATVNADAYINNLRI
jgi:hypothetical protein